jgi:hypothetical protein
MGVGGEGRGYSMESNRECGIDYPVTTSSTDMLRKPYDEEDGEWKEGRATRSLDASTYAGSGLMVECHTEEEAQDALEMMELTKEKVEVGRNDTGDDVSSARRAIEGYKRWQQQEEEEEEEEHAQQQQQQQEEEEEEEEEERGAMTGANHEGPGRDGAAGGEEEAPVVYAALDNRQEQEGDKSDKEQGLSVSLNEIIKILFGTDLIVDALVNRVRQQYYLMDEEGGGFIGRALVICLAEWVFSQCSAYSAGDAADVAGADARDILSALCRRKVQHGVMQRLDHAMDQYQDPSGLDADEFIDAVFVLC